MPSGAALAISSPASIAGGHVCPWRHTDMRETPASGASFRHDSRSINPLSIAKRAGLWQTVQRDIFRNKWPSFFREMWHGCRMGGTDHQALAVSRSSLDGSVLRAML